MSYKAPNFTTKIQGSWYFIGLLIAACLFRIFLLGNVPTGVSNDELDYILNAKSVFLQQSDISNTWNPFSLTTPKSSFPQAEIAPLIMALPIGILPLSLFFSKLSYALISIGTIIIIYLIAKRLFDQKVAVIAGLIASVNPWLIFFGRTAYDTPLAIFFYLFALYILLVARKWYILVAFPLFLLGFYSYIGTKLILIPFVAITSYYSWRFINNKKYTKQYLILATLCLMLLFSYIIQTFTSGKNRVSEISNPFMPSITTTVDYQRKQSLDTPFNGIFSNKFTVFTDYSIEKYINTFSPNFLFLSGDAKPQFSLWEHGVFYLIDGFFIIIGLYFLFKKYKKEAVLFSSLLLLAPLPSLISNVGTSYAIRSMLMAPLLLILAGMGVKYIIDTVKPKTFKTLTVCLIIIFYLFQILNFLNIYLLRNPIYNSESFNFSSRELAKYLSLTHQNKNIYVVNGDPKSPLKHYLFYTNSLNRKMLGDIALMYKNKKYQIGNIHFITCQQIPNNLGSDLLIYESSSRCKNLPGGKLLSIGQLSDSGSIQDIVNDTACSKHNLKQYISGLSFTDLNIEKQTEKEFCEKYIIRR